MRTETETHACIFRHVQPCNVAKLLCVATAHVLEA